MAKKSDNRGPVEMRCSECKSYLRPTSKNKKNTADRLELKKFCPTCGKHTIVKEKK